MVWFKHYFYLFNINQNYLFSQRQKHSYKVKRLFIIKTIYLINGCPLNKKVKTGLVIRLMCCEAKATFVIKCACFRLKYKSSIHNIAFSSEKVILSE